MTTKFIAAERLRKTALDYIKANPGCVLSAVHVHLRRGDRQVTDARTSQLLGRMLKMGEVSRETGGHGIGNRRCFRFFAAADQTRSAEDTLMLVAGNLQEPGWVPKAKLKKIAGGPIHRLFGGLDHCVSAR